MKKWDEMTARERDALVAEKVMKLKLVADFPELYSDHYWSELTSMPLSIPRYTTDVSAAWEVLEQFGGGYMIAKFSSTMTYRVTIFALVRAEVDKKSLSEAICLAALRAVGVEV